MGFKINAQKRWLGISFILVAIIIIVITVLVTRFEKNRYQQENLSSNMVIFQEIGTIDSIKQPNTYGSKTHLKFLTTVVLGTGFIVLLITLVLNYYMFKKSLLPLDEVLNQLSELKNAKTGDELKKKFDNARFDHRGNDLKEIIKLKEEFHSIREKVIFSWNQMEFNQSDLELKLEKSNTKS